MLLSVCLAICCFEDTAMSPDDGEIIYMLTDRCSAHTNVKD